VLTLVTIHVWKQQILVSLGSTTLGAHGWYTVLLEAETAGLLTVQVDLPQQAVPIHFNYSFFNSTYTAFELEQSIMNGD
jgi:hypothetical protein